MSDDVKSDMMIDDVEETKKEVVKKETKKKTATKKKVEHKVDTVEFDLVSGDHKGKHVIYKNGYFRVGNMFSGVQHRQTNVGVSPRITNDEISKLKDNEKVEVIIILGRTNSKAELTKKQYNDLMRLKSENSTKLGGGVSSRAYNSMIESTKTTAQKVASGARRAFGGCGSGGCGG